MEFTEVVTTTRAVRRYRGDPIPEEDLSRILFAASRAPSGSNRQPFRFLVLRDGPTAVRARALLGETFRSMWAQKAAAERYGEGSGADSDSPKARMAAAMDHFVEHAEETPVFIVACLRLRHGGHLVEGASIFPACQNLLLAARELGYGGVLTTWHLPAAQELAEILGLPDDVAIPAVIPLGRPQGRHGPVRRRPLTELVFDDEWGQKAPWVSEPPGTRHIGGATASEARTAEEG